MTERMKFETTDRRGSAGVAYDEPIEFELDGRVLTANPPTSGQLTLFLTAGRKGKVGALQSLFQFLANVLSESDYAVIEQALNDGVDVDVIYDIVTYLVGEWSNRPTKPASGSPSTQKSTDKSSTAKQSSKAKPKS